MIYLLDYYLKHYMVIKLSFINNFESERLRNISNYDVGLGDYLLNNYV